MNGMASARADLERRCICACRRPPLPGRSSGVLGRLAPHAKSLMQQDWSAGQMGGRRDYEYRRSWRARDPSRANLRKRCKLDRARAHAAADALRARGNRIALEDELSPSSGSVTSEASGFGTDSLEEFIAAWPQGNRRDQIAERSSRTGGWLSMRFASSCRRSNAMSSANAGV